MQVRLHSRTEMALRDTLNELLRLSRMLPCQPSFCDSHTPLNLKISVQIPCCTHRFEGIWHHQRVINDNMQTATWFYRPANLAGVISSRVFITFLSGFWGTRLRLQSEWKMKSPFIYLTLITWMENIDWKEYFETTITSLTQIQNFPGGKLNPASVAKG